MFFRNIKIWFEKISCKSSCCTIYRNEEYITTSEHHRVTSIKAISTSSIKTLEDLV